MSSNNNKSAGRMPALPAGEGAPDESWRLFIAIELPSTLRKRVQDHIIRLRQAVPDARASWAREENLHLTLKFLGDIPVTKVEVLAQVTERAVAQASPFQLVISDCGAFPIHGQPRVLWIGIKDPTNNLNQLYQALENECTKAGFAQETRPFHPHLTIARIRQPPAARRLVEVHRDIGFEPVAVNVRDLCLIRSELRSEGSRYTVISRQGLSDEVK